MIAFLLVSVFSSSLVSAQKFPTNLLDDLLYNDYYDLPEPTNGEVGYMAYSQQNLPPKPEDTHKSSLLPAYCDPPNPCPAGYTAQDGCIESFENKAEFSRHYQASQSCMCDTEHMFSCPQGNVDMYGIGKGQEDDLHLPENPFSEDNDNPYLAGIKLPIAAKKGLGY